MKLDPRMTVINSKYEPIKLSVYLTLVRGEKNALIDTGTKFSPQPDILPALKQFGLTLKDIDYILITHGHNDHVGGAAELKKAGRAKIMIHPAEILMLENKERFLKEWFGPVVEGILGKAYVEEEWAKYSSFDGPEVKADRMLKDNDIFDLGKGVVIKALHLPGHAGGAMGFYRESEGVLVGGDAFPCLMDRDGALPNVTDLEAYKKSIRRVLELPLKASILSHEHWGISSRPAYIRDGAQTTQFLKECLEVAERMQEAVAAVAPRAAGRPFQAVYDEIVGKLPASWDFGPFEKVPIKVMSGQIILFELKRLGILMKG